MSTHTVHQCTDCGAITMQETCPNCGSVNTVVVPSGSSSATLAGKITTSTTSAATTSIATAANAGVFPDRRYQPSSPGVSPSRHSPVHHHQNTNNNNNNVVLTTTTQQQVSPRPPAHQSSASSNFWAMQDAQPSTLSNNTNAPVSSDHHGNVTQLIRRVRQKAGSANQNYHPQQQQQFNNESVQNKGTLMDYYDVLQLCDAAATFEGQHRGLHQELDSWKSKYSVVTRERDRLQGDMYDVNDQFEKLQSKLTGLSEYNQRLQHQLQEQQAHQGDHETAIAGLRQQYEMQIEGLRNNEGVRVREQERELARLQKRELELVESLRAARFDVEGEHQENARRAAERENALRNDYENLKLRIKDLEASYETRLAEQSGSAGTANRRVRQLEDEMALLRDSFESEKRDLTQRELPHMNERVRAAEATALAYQERIRDYEASKRQWDDERVNLTQQITTLTYNLKGAERGQHEESASLKQQCLGLEEKLQQYEREIPVLRETLAAAEERMAENDALKAELRQAEQRAHEQRSKWQVEIAPLYDSLSAAQEKIADADIVQGRMATVAAELDTERSAHMQTKADLHEALGIKQSLDVEISELKRQVIDAEVEKNHHVGDTDRWQKQLRSEQDRNKELEFTLEKLRLEGKGHDDIVRELKLQIERLHGEISVLNAKVESQSMLSLSTEHTHDRTKVEHERQISDLTQQQYVLTMDLNNVRAENAAMHADVKRLSTTMARNKELEAEVTDLQQRLSSAQSRVPVDSHQKVQTELQAAQDRYRDLQRKLGQAEHTVEILQSEHAAEKVRLESAMTSAVSAAQTTRDRFHLVETERDAVRRELDEANAKLSQSNIDINAVSADAEEARRSLRQEAEREIERLRRELRQKQSEVDELRAAVMKVELRGTEMETVRQRQAHLVADLESEVKGLRTERDAVIVEVNSLQRELEAALSASVELRQQHSESRTKGQEEKGELEGALVDLQKALRESTADRMELIKDRDRLRQEVQSAEDRAQQERVNLQKFEVESERYVQGYKVELEQLRTELTAVQGSLKHERLLHSGDVKLLEERLSKIATTEEQIRREQQRALELARAEDTEGLRHHYEGVIEDLRQQHLALTMKMNHVQTEKEAESERANVAELKHQQLKTEAIEHFTALERERQALKQEMGRDWEQLVHRVHSTMTTAAGEASPQKHHHHLNHLGSSSSNNNKTSQQHFYSSSNNAIQVPSFLQGEDVNTYNAGSVGNTVTNTLTEQIYANTFVNTTSNHGGGRVSSQSTSPVRIPRPPTVPSSENVTIVKGAHVSYHQQQPSNSKSNSNNSNNNVQQQQQHLNNSLQHQHNNTNSHSSSSSSKTSKTTVSYQPVASTSTIHFGPALTAAAGPTTVTTTATPSPALNMPQLPFKPPQYPHNNSSIIEY